MFALPAVEKQQPGSCSEQLPLSSQLGDRWVPGWGSLGALPAVGTCCLCAGLVLSLGRGQEGCAAPHPLGTGSARGTLEPASSA